MDFSKKVEKQYLKKLQTLFALLNKIQ